MTSDIILQASIALFNSGVLYFAFKDHLPAPTVLMLQSLDPTSYATSWGVLGALVFVIIIMGGIMYKIFTRTELDRKERDQVIMGFVNDHRRETHNTLSSIAETISRAHREGADAVSKALERNTRVLDDVWQSTKFLDRIREMKRSGDLSDADVDKIVKAWVLDRGSETRQTK